MLCHIECVSTLNLLDVKACKAIASAAQTAMSQQEKPVCDWSNFDHILFNLGINVQSSVTKINAEGRRIHHKVSKYAGSLEGQCNADDKIDKRWTEEEMNTLLSLNRIILDVLKPASMGSTNVNRELNEYFVHAGAEQSE